MGSGKESLSHYKQRTDFRVLGPNRLLPGRANETSFAYLQTLSDQDLLEVTSLRTLLLSITGTNNFSEIPSLFSQPEKQKSIEDQLVMALGNRYGIEGNSEKVRGFIRLSMSDANQVIDRFENPQNGIFRNYHQQIESISEIKTINDPIDLLFICFSSKASKRLRYEARRKLVLFDLAMRVNTRKEEIEPFMDKFGRFLNSHVWSQDELGATDELEFISYHSPKDYSCTHIHVLKPEEKTSVSEFSLYHMFPMRRFNTKHGSALAYSENRLKSTSDIVIKLLRKNTKDPQVIDDLLGFKFTFVSREDILSFITQIQTEAYKQGIAINTEDNYHTIDNDDSFRVTNPGSSEKLNIVKVHLPFQGKRIELQLHTLKTYLNSRYQDGVGWEEFSLQRVIENGNFNTSVIDLLYPEDIYGNLSPTIDEILKDIRESNRRRSRLLPEQHRLKQHTLERYSDTDLARDVTNILGQLKEIPDSIIAVGNASLPAALELSNHLGNVKIITLDTLPNQISGNILIVDDIGAACSHIKALKQQYPTAKAAVLAKRRGSEDAHGCVDYYGREISDSTWLDFSWDRGLKEASQQIYANAVMYRLNASGKLEILFQKTHKGTYKLPGGEKNREDNGLPETIIRELQEEIGEKISADQLSLTVDHTYQHPANHIYKRGFCRFFAIPYSTQGEFILDEEIESMVWVPASQALEKVHPPEYQDGLKTMIDLLNQQLC